MNKSLFSDNFVSIFKDRECELTFHNPSIGFYMCFSIKLKYVHLYTVTHRQSRQVPVARQCPLETALIETHGRPDGLAPWWEEAKLYMLLTNLLRNAKWSDKMWHQLPQAHSRKVVCA